MLLVATQAPHTDWARHTQTKTRDWPKDRGTDEDKRLTEGSDELPLHGPGERVHQAGRGEACEHHVVEEYDVEVAQPVVASKVSQQIKPGDAWGGERWSGVIL